MSVDLARVSEVRAWLVKAASDLRSAEFGMRAAPGIHGDVVFHCQQAAEKSLTRDFVRPTAWKRSANSAWLSIPA